MKRVYLDYSATTPCSKQVFKSMEPYYTEIFGNADSLHSYGLQASYGVDMARRSVAELIGAKSNEIIFTSGGTEANNLALKGIANALKSKGNHIIISSVEHSSIMDNVAVLKDSGFIVSIAKVDANGILDIDYFKSLVTDKTILASVMIANNEIGTIMPIAELSKFCKEKNIILHTDAVSGMGYIDINVNKLMVDAMSFSAHKFYGPKGVGALYLKKGTPIKGINIGGHQERTIRGGTSFVAGVVGMARALETACQNLDNNIASLTKKRDYFIAEIKKQLPNIAINGSMDSRVCHNVNICFRGFKASEIIHSLDLVGVACSGGSACSSGSLEPSYVLKAIGLSDTDALSCVRFSVGLGTTTQELDYAVEQLVKIVKNISVDSKELILKVDSKTKRV